VGICGIATSAGSGMRADEPSAIRVGEQAHATQETDNLSVTARRGKKSRKGVSLTKPWMFVPTVVCHGPGGKAVRAGQRGRPGWMQAGLSLVGSGIARARSQGGLYLHDMGEVEVRQLQACRRAERPGRSGSVVRIRRWGDRGSCMEVRGHWRYLRSRILHAIRSDPQQTQGPLMPSPDPHMRARTAQYQPTRSAAPVLSVR
jgi:hypothetical protein